MTLCRLAAALAVSATLALSACGGGGDQPAPASSAPVPPTPGSASAPAPARTSASAGSSPTPEPGALTPVPPPTPGDTSSTVAPRPVETRKPVKLDQPAVPTREVTVRVTRLRAVQAKAQGPGEVSGPGLELRVQVRNQGSALDLSGAAVTLTAADGSPGQMMTGPPAAPLPASVAAGRTATGTYVFTVPKGQRDPVQVVVTLSEKLAVVTFSGSGPR
jgi:hypothetical protein